MRISISGPLATLIPLALVVACSDGAGDGATTKDAVSKAGSAQAVDANAKGAANILALGRTETGDLGPRDPTLDDGSSFDLWIYQGRAGETISVTMRSQEFDSYLVLAESAQGEFLATDDDSGGDLDARLVFEIPADGDYFVLANSLGAGESGSYTLLVEAGDAPPAEYTMENRDWEAMYPGGGDPAGRYALLVGIDDYAGSANDLAGPVADARLIGRILQERYGFAAADVVVITDADATREHITQAFLRHLGQAGPTGVAVFYYSGHGMQMDGNYALTGSLDPEEDDIDEALLVRGPTSATSVVLDDELGFLADRLTTERVLFIIDACFSGTGTRGTAGGGQAKEVTFDAVKSTLALPASYLTSETPQANPGTETTGIGDLLREPQRHLLLAASADDQLSWTATGWPKYGGTVSVFTYYLAEALESAPANRTFDQLIEGIRTQTLNFTRSTYNTPQTPQAEGRLRTTSVGDFLGR